MTGSRTWTDYEMIHNLLSAADRREGPHTLVHGGAGGADSMADAIARELGWAVEVYKANWERDKRAAGILRNHHMVNLGADLCLAFIRDNSRGATHCANIARIAGITVAKFHASSEATNSFNDRPDSPGQ